MFILRLGLAERSHLIEYSVLAIFIHRALIERIGKESPILKPAIYAIVLTFLTGLLDECIQLFLPDRVFDSNDIMFNGFAAALAIGASLLLQWARNKLRKTD